MNKKNKQSDHTITFHILILNFIVVVHIHKLNQFNPILNFSASSVPGAASAGPCDRTRTGQPGSLDVKRACDDYHKNAIPSFLYLRRGCIFTKWPIQVHDSGQACRIRIVFEITWYKFRLSWNHVSWEFYLFYSSLS